MSALTGIPRRSHCLTGIGGRKHFWDPGLPVVRAPVPTARSSRELRAAKRVVVWVESQCQQKVFPARDRERRRVREKLRVKLWNFKRLGYVSLEEQTQRNNFKNPTKQEMIVYAKKFMIGAAVQTERRQALRDVARALDVAALAAPRRWVLLGS